METRRQFLAYPALLAGAPAAFAQLGAIYDVRKFGAAGDGSKLDTAAIQRAVDECSKTGGGTVLLPRGVYRSGTVQLRDRVTLHLAEGSRLTGSKQLSDYPSRVAAFRSYTDNYTEKSLLYAENASSVAIEGKGTIDGEGASFKGPYKVRPYTMRFIGCRDVTVRDVRIVNSPMWVQHYLDCEDVHLTGLRVHSRVNHNNDGIDIDCCRRVRISDCDIWSGDDAIVFKSTADKPCRDVVVTNCVLSSLCNALKLGTESNGGFEDIAVSNCTVYDTRLAGIAVEMVDGGLLDRVAFSNISMRNVRAPIFIRLGNRARPFLEGGPKPGMGKLRNVLIQGVYSTGGARIGCPISGLPGHPVEHVTLRDIALSFEGGGTREDAERVIPEEPEKYPEFGMFGVLPAYGFYVRHARDVHFDNVRCSTVKADARPAVVTEDVEEFDVRRFRPAESIVHRRQG